jgi:hypothetical protein
MADTIPWCVAYKRAEQYGKHFKSVIYVPDKNIDPEDYLLELIEVYSGRPRVKVGSGIHATVFKGPNSTVFKVGSAARNCGYLEYFSQWQKDVDNPFYPKVFWSVLVLNPDQETAYYAIMMEKLLETWSKRVRKMTKGFKPSMANVLFQVADCIDRDTDILMSKRIGPPPESFYRAKGAILQAQEKDGNCALDLHDGNFMWRPDGQLVITDPLC